jgi:hypothetical protein
MRHAAGKTVEIAATETTPLEPGDLLKVELASGQGGEAEAALALRDVNAN